MKKEIKSEKELNKTPFFQENEENYNKNFVENLDLIQFSNGENYENYENYDNYNDLEEMYNDKNIEKGFF